MSKEHKVHRVLREGFKVRKVPQVLQGQREHKVLKVLRRVHKVLRVLKVHKVLKVLKEEHKVLKEP